MTITIIAIFPELIECFLQKGVIGEAIRNQKIKVNFLKLKDFATDKHKRTDERPFGGGPGMVLKFEPVFNAIYKRTGSRLLSILNKNRQNALKQKAGRLSKKHTELQNRINILLKDHKSSKTYKEKNCLLKQIKTYRKEIDFIAKKLQEQQTGIKNFKKINLSDMEFAHNHKSMQGNLTKKIKKVFKIFLMDPSGQDFNFKKAGNMASFLSSKSKNKPEEKEIILICGRYQGFDERIKLLCHQKLKVSNAVLSGGELAATCILDSVVRLIPSVLHNENSKEIETFENKNYPLFTTPVSLSDSDQFADLKVDDIFLNGNHAEIQKARDINI